MKTLEFLPTLPIWPEVTTENYFSQPEPNSVELKNTTETRADQKKGSIPQHCFAQRWGGWCTASCDIRSFEPKNLESKDWSVGIIPVRKVAEEWAEKNKLRKLRIYSRGTSVTDPDPHRSAKKKCLLGPDPGGEKPMKCTGSLSEHRNKLRILL